MTNTVYIVTISILCLIIVVLIVGCSTNWFQFEKFGKYYCYCDGVPCQYGLCPCAAPDCFDKLQH